MFSYCDYRGDSGQKSVKYMDLYNKIEAAHTYLKDRVGRFSAPIAIILGSSFGHLASLVDIKWEIPYSEIPQFPKTTVPGHKGKLLVGTIHGMNILMMQGRFHYYEGHSMQTLSIPIRLFAQFGVKSLILTNAAGAVNPALTPGDLMVIEDHINLSFQNPLLGPNLDQFGTRFPDTTQTYTKHLREQAYSVAASQKIHLQKGVYLFTTGPNYETPAEVRMMHRLGADVVGMSTVPEALTAKHAGMEVFGLSLVSNYGAGLSDHPLSHDEVLTAMEQKKTLVRHFIRDFLHTWKQ